MLKRLRALDDNDAIIDKLTIFYVTLISCPFTKTKRVMKRLVILMALFITMAMPALPVSAFEHFYGQKWERRHHDRDRHGHGFIFVIPSPLPPPQPYYYFRPLPAPVCTDYWHPNQWVWNGYQYEWQEGSWERVCY